MKIKVKYIPSNFVARIGYNGKRFFVMKWDQLISKKEA